LITKYYEKHDHRFSVASLILVQKLQFNNSMRVNFMIDAIESVRSCGFRLLAESGLKTFQSEEEMLDENSSTIFNDPWSALSAPVRVRGIK
jgi:hypothetical protein